MKAATLADALATGYRRCDGRYGDVDTSGPAEGGGEWVGYTYVARDGRVSRKFQLTADPSRAGHAFPVCYLPLMPLNEGVSAAQEHQIEKARRRGERAAVESELVAALAAAQE